MPVPSPEVQKIYEELVAVAMLAAEGRPVYCSCCMGRGREKQFIGWRRCPQCRGLGFEAMGRETKKYLIRSYYE